jgi:hypothetical protein
MISILYIKLYTKIFIFDLSIKNENMGLFDYLKKKKKRRKI